MSEKNGKQSPAHRQLFPTIEAAKEVSPPSEKYRIIVVTGKDGGKVYTWSRSYDGALATLARSNGAKARVAEPKGAGPLTAEKVAAKLAEMTDEELAALGLTRKKTAKK